MIGRNFLVLVFLILSQRGKWLWLLTCWWRHSFLLRWKITTNVVSVLAGQRNREVAKMWSYRRMCNKPQEPKLESPPSTAPEHRALDSFNMGSIISSYIKDAKATCSCPPCSCCTAPRASFKVPGYRPSEMDRKILLWSGRYKTADQIPEFVSWVPSSCLYQHPPPLIGSLHHLVKRHQKSRSQELRRHRSHVCLWSRMICCWDNCCGL